MDTRRKIDAVIFDMDGLMLDTERLARVAWNRAMADWGYTIPDEVYQQLIGRTIPDVGSILRDKVAADLPFGEISERKQQYADQEIAQHGVAVKPGVFELLEWLERTRRNKAVASSTFRERVMQKLNRAGLAHRFDAIVCGDEIRRGKPAPDIYLAAAHKLSVRADRCVGLEDSEPGIRAAQAAGMMALMVPDQISPSPEIVQMARESGSRVRVFPSLLEVKQFLEQVFLEQAIDS